MPVFFEKVKGSNMKPEILREDKTDHSEKKRLKIVSIFDPFIVKMQSEKYFSIFFQFLLKRFKQKLMN